LDVHKDTVVVCVRCVSPPAHRKTRCFATTTSGLLELAEWLSAHGCTHVAMEATGVYRRPVWHMLEDGFALVLANARHIRNVPGRKTDVSGAMWIADLLAHGLIRSGFVPPAAIQELRDLTRTRKQLVREGSPAFAAHPEGSGRRHQARQRAFRRADRIRASHALGDHRR
jgi:transposase